MKKISVTIEGVTPLLQHKMPQEDLYKLLGAKSERKKSEEELTPREIAQKYVYQTTEGIFYVPSEHLCGAVMGVASDYKLKNSTRKSMKTIARGVFRPCSEAGFLVNPENNETIKDFEVDVRKATNHQKGAVAVCRPRFDKWKATFEVQIDDSLLPVSTAHDMLNDAGKRSGIGSYRVSKGGYFGQFRVTEFKEL